MYNRIYAIQKVKLIIAIYRTTIYGLYKYYHALHFVSNYKSFILDVKSVILYYNCPEDGKFVIENSGASNFITPLLFIFLWPNVI